MAELDAFFQPKSVAILGASERPGSMGGLVLRNLQQAGYAHPVLAVNKKGYASVHGVPCTTSLSREHNIELAVICLPATGLLRAIKSVAAAGVRAALVLTGGMARDHLSASRMRRLTLIARRRGVRLLGPNSLGLIVPFQNLNLSWSHIQAPKGNIAYVGMSSALGSALLDWAAGRGYGFSHFVTVGARADISVSDVVDYLSGDRRVKAILLHVENIRNAERFMTVLRAASKTKKVLVLNTDLGTQVPEGLANRNALNQAFFDRAGVLQVANFQSLLGTLQTLTRSRPLYSHRLALASNGLGPALLTRQEMQRQGGDLMTLTPMPDVLAPFVMHRERSTDDFLVLPAAVTAAELTTVLATLDGVPDVGAIMVVLVPNARLDVAALTRVIMTAQKRTRRTLMVVWLGEATVTEARDTLDAANILNFDTTEAAVAAYTTMVRHERVQGFLRETPEKNRRVAPAEPLLEAIHERAQQNRQAYMGWQNTRDLLAQFGFRLNEAEFFPDQAALIRAAGRMAFPVAVRLLNQQYSFPFAYSSEARHRWRGVAINVQRPEQLKAEADRLRSELALYLPDSPVLGYVVQPMRRHLDALQFSLGITRDEVFGPILLFGLGGSSANVRSDRNSALPPLNRTLARLLLEDTHVYDLLQERSREPERVEEVLIDAIMRLSELAEQCPWLVGLEMNLLLENEHELVVLGAAAEHGADRRPAIPMYPQRWVQTLTRKGETYTLRPVRAEDEPALKTLYESQPPETLRLRFFGSRLHFAHRELAAMCQIDYRREMAMVLETRTGHVVGEVRGWTRVDAHSMEFAILLDAEAQGKGLAQALLGQLEAFAVTMNVDRMTADILPENTAMRQLGERMGYKIISRDADSIVMEKPLEP